MELNVEQYGPALYKAILLYGDNRSSKGSRIVCSFDAQEGELVNGRFLTDKDMVRLFKGLYSSLSEDVNRKNSYNKLHDHRVLGAGDAFLCFEIPAHKRSLFFGDNLPDLKGVKIPLPRLIVILSHNSSYLFAVKARGRITGRTPLYHAPIPENDLKGKIHSCGFRWPKNRFSPINVDGCISTILDSMKFNVRHNKLCFGDYSEVLNQAIESRKFPSSALVPVRKKLGSVLADLSA